MTEPTQDTPEWVATPALIAAAGVATPWVTLTAAADQITTDQVADYIRTAKSDPRLNRCLAGARAEILTAFDRAYRPIPGATFRQCILDVALELHRRPDHNSVPSQYADVSTGTAVRAAKDPLATCRPVIDRYVLPF